VPYLKPIVQVWQTYTTSTISLIRGAPYIRLTPDARLRPPIEYHYWNHRVVNHQTLIAFSQNQRRFGKTTVGDYCSTVALIKSLARNHLLYRFVADHIRVTFGLDGNTLAIYHRD
jgi:hypothetical protein